MHIAHVKQSESQRSVHTLVCTVRSRLHLLHMPSF